MLFMLELALRENGVDDERTQLILRGAATLTVHFRLDHRPTVCT